MCLTLLHYLYPLRFPAEEFCSLIHATCLAYPVFFLRMVLIEFGKDYTLQTPLLSLLTFLQSRVTFSVLGPNTQSSLCVKFQLL